MQNFKKIDSFTRYTALFCLLFFSASCSKEEEEDIEVLEPLNCLYPGDLKLDQQTKNSLSKYKEKPLQASPSEENKVFVTPQAKSGVK